MVFKLPPFVGCVIALFGFSEEDTKDMEAILVQNGMVYSFIIVLAAFIEHFISIDFIELHRIHCTIFNRFALCSNCFLY